MIILDDIPDSKVHGANMGPIWGQQDPGGPHVGPKNFAIWDGETGAVRADEVLELLSYYWDWGETTSMEYDSTKYLEEIIWEEK